MKPLKIKVSITLDETILSQTKLLAEKCDRSLSQFVNLMLHEYLQNKNQICKTHFKYVEHKKRFDD